ncbi:GntR family transcriptional regulator [Devosia pacifica]|uniref:GntR family transcriptional regulator n=1 Tax=Devosia pacifica TaxID=1335967 RepID=A0A918S3N6_9HYPH|nr:PLP-dependent aminotransferase family protein [Devosia pacifica]GHA21342.1 GntR family transcriptional regulator [Devosia pacifica]
MPKPPFSVLADAVAEEITSGRVPPGTRLPTHRQFAEEHTIALATATRVYRELEARGLVVGEAGRGVFVRDPGVPAKLGMQQAAADGLIDLVFNVPANPADAEMLRTGLKRLAAGGDLEAMMRYQPHAGRQHERSLFARHAARSLGPVDPERLIITSGAQHGLALSVLGVMDRGDQIGTDLLTYSGFASVAALKGLSLVPVPATPQMVMDTEMLERICCERTLRALYLMPTVQNPLGSVMDETTRQRIVDIARQHDLLIIEDGAYAFLEPDPPPSLLHLAPERTIYVGSFSKSLGTGLRVGYVIAPEELAERLVAVMRATTWNTPAVMSGLLAGWIEDGTVSRAEEARRVDGAKRQALCREILAGSELIGHRNAGFAWLPNAGRQRTEPIVSRLRAKGVAVSPSSAFAIGEAVPQAIRLAFGGVSIPDLEQAMAIVREELNS